MKPLTLGSLLAVVTIGFSPVNAASEKATPVPSVSPSPATSVPQASLAPTPSPTAEPEKAPDQPSNRTAPIPTEARRMALEVAGAFQRDGFRIRDGEWGGSLTKKVPLFLRLTLFAGESYWFVAASPAPGATLRVTLYDAQGKALKTEQWKDEGDESKSIGGSSAAGVAPDQSGKYFVSVELVDTPTDLPAEFSLIYAYK